jgi:hypothetical protein
MTQHRAKARTCTKPLSRTPTPACRHRHIWAYHHNPLTEADIHVVALVFGITEKQLLETALRLDREM